MVGVFVPPIESCFQRMMLTLLLESHVSQSETGTDHWTGEREGRNSEGPLRQDLV